MRTNATVQDELRIALIFHVRLKNPITVVARGERDGKPQHDLVCGQGRLEAFRQLGEQVVPALVVEANREDLLLMSLARSSEIISPANAPFSHCIIKLCPQMLKLA